MPAALFKVVISPLTRPNQPGRGFYQLEEDSLYVPIGAYSSERRFFSSIESEIVRLDMDKTGELLFIEISLPRKKWKVEPSLVIPNHSSPADLRWLDFRAEFDNPPVLTNAERTAVCVKFSSEVPAAAYRLAESVIVETTDKLHVCRLWIIDIIDDVGGREISAFRKQHPGG